MSTPGPHLLALKVPTFPWIMISQLLLKKLTFELSLVMWKALNQQMLGEIQRYVYDQPFPQ